MDILKKLFFVTIVLLFVEFDAVSQENKTLINAFETSYSNESAGNYAKSIENLKSVYDEKSYEINLRLGWLTYLSGLFTESSAYYQKAIALKPLSIEAKFGFVLPASSLGNWDSVIKQYKDILAIDPNNTIVNYRLGLIYYGKEDFTNAYKYFEKNVNLYPFDYDSMIMYAWTNYKKGMLREAKVLFNKVLIIRPNDTSATEGLRLIK